MADSAGSPSAIDRVFDALAAEDRRRLLSQLQRQDAPRELPLRSTVPPDRDATTYLTRMRHVHLPKLAEYEYVSLSTDRKVVRPGERFEDVASVIAVLREEQARLPDDVL